MPLPKISDDDLIRFFPLLGAGGIAAQFGITTAKVYERRRVVEGKHGITLEAPTKRNKPSKGILHAEVKDGIVLVGSDCHFWPGVISTAHRAFCKLAKELKPKIVIANGDVMDGATISRHVPIGWEDRPKLIEELETCQERLGEITKAAGRARRIWSLGNHDARLETKIATFLPEYAKVNGVHLKDHFPDWEPCWSIWINNEVVVKHRFRGGIHATHNNVMWAGKTIVTGHLHSLKVTPFTDYNGVRYGVDCGTLAPIYGPQFTYLETNPVNWRSGFVILHFWKGRLLHPQIVMVMDEDEGLVDVGGKVIKV